MTPQDVEHQMKRVQRFRQLEERAVQIRAALHLLEDRDPTGPCEQNAFTSNTREARRVTNLGIRCSATNGGSPPVSVDLSYLSIRAGALAQFLIAELRAELEQVNKQMEDL